MKYCGCGEVIDQKRIDAVTLNGRFPMSSSLKCVSCAEGTVKRKAGFMPSQSKMLGEIIIAEEDVVRDLHKDAWRAGTGVSRGMKA